MNYNIVTENNIKYAVLENGTRYVVHTNKSGNEYICVDNPNDKDGLFNGRIKDAVDVINAGGGDVVEIGKLFGSTIIDVLYFLDRTVGNELRSKSIEGWKDAEFKWIVTCGSKKSQFGYMPITSEFSYVMPYSNAEQPMLFDTEDDAKIFITNVLIEKVKGYIVDYLKEIEGTSNVDGRNESFKAMLARIKAESPKGNVISYFAMDMLDADTLLLRDNYALNNYGYAVEQYCVVND